MLNKNQFEALVYQVIQKIKSIEGVESYISDTPCCFDNTRGDKHLYYLGISRVLIDLNKLSDDGATIPSNDYCSFMDQLLLDTEEVIKAANLQRQPFLDYLEKIERL